MVQGKRHLPTVQKGKGRTRPRTVLVVPTVQQPAPQWRTASAEGVGVSYDNEFPLMLQRWAVLCKNCEADPTFELLKWENTWSDTGESGDVVDMDLVDVREPCAGDTVIETHVDAT